MTRLLAILLILSPAPLFADKDAWVFESVHGKRVAPFENESTRALVVVFIATDCPIANYFQPTLRRLRADRPQ